MNFYILTFKNEKTDRTIFIAILCFILFCFLSIASLVYIVDPFQFFHKSFISSKFSGNQRYQSPGLIKNYPAANYIFGTSMTENFKASEVKAVLQIKDLQRLSISGVLPQNFATVLNYLLENNKVESIILDAHWYFESEDIEKENKQHDFPSYLYSSRLLDKMKYLFNHDNLKLSIALLRGRERGFYNDLDTINRWMNPVLFEKFNNPISLKKIEKKLEKNRRILLSTDLLQSGEGFKYPSIDRYLLSILRNFPQVKFHIFLPPYSTWYYASDGRRSFIDRLIYMRKYLADKSYDLKNVRLYGFDNDYKIVNNLKNYKDYGHFHPRVNDRIIRSIKDGSNILDKKNSERYLIKMISNINSYQL
jgi:hypothetical protein